MQPSNLIHKKCVPCEGKAERLSKKRVLAYLRNLSRWKLSSSKKSIFAEWGLKDFMSAITLIRKIAVIAEKEDHHPDIHLTKYRKLKIELSTHAIDGLSENDFILASKINRLKKKLKIA